MPPSLAHKSQVRIRGYLYAWRGKLRAEGAAVLLRILRARPGLSPRELLRDFHISDEVHCGGARSLDRLD